MKGTFQFLKIKARIPKLLCFWSLFTLLFVIWLITRFYQLETNYNFSWDEGYHSSILYNWQVNHQFPFYGPQTSYVTFYISPVYYYLLYPAYVLSSQHFLYNHLTAFTYTWAIFIGLAAVLRKRPAHRWNFLLLVTLLCFSPIVITQFYKVIWNPSYVWQPLLVATYALILIPSSRRKLLLAITSGASCALSCAFNLSVWPVALGLTLVAIMILGKKWWWWLSGLIGNALLLYSPSIYKEIAAPGNLRYFPSPYPTGNFLTRLMTLSYYVVNFTNINLQNLQNKIVTIAFMATLIAAIVISLVKYRRSSNSPLCKNICFQLTVANIVIIIITALPPVALDPMYGLGVTALVFLLLVNLNSRFKYLLIAGFLVHWAVQFPQSNLYTTPETSFYEYNSCAKFFCQKPNEVSAKCLVQLEELSEKYTAHAYLLTLNGCQPQANR